MAGLLTEASPGAALQVPPVLTKSGYATYRGVSPSMVSKLIRQKKLLAPALQDDGSIIVSLADAMLERNLDPSRARRAAAFAQFARPDAPPERSAEREQGQISGEDSFAAAKARRERANAALAEIELQQARRELLPAKALHDVMREIGTAVGQQLDARRMDLAHELLGKGSIAEILSVLEAHDRRYRKVLSEIGTREAERARAA